MAKQFKQYRYYGDVSNMNYPADLKKIHLTTGSVFEAQISDLKIQSYPGTKFYLNDSDDWIMIGSSGEYHLELEGNYEISSLRFDSQFLDAYFSGENDTAYIIVDIIYNSTEG